MTKKYISYFAPLILFAAFLIDGQLSTLLINWAPDRVIIASHLLLMAGIFLTQYLPVSYMIVLFTLLGLSYDLYYLGVLGIATTLFPLMAYIVYYFHQELGFKRITNLILLLVLVFGFEFTSFLFARLFHMTNLSMFIFVFYNLVPTLVFNFLLLLIFQPLLERFFGITNKT